MSGIGIIANPHSKLNKRNPARQKLLGYIIGQQGQLEITHNLSELRRAAGNFRDSGIDVLGINGGDGTISRTLTAIIREYGDKPLPKIAILTGGTINMLAGNLAIKGSPEQILYRLVEASSNIGAIECKEIGTLKVGDDYGFMLATGVAPNFLTEYYKKKSGPLGAIWLIFKTWLSWFVKGKLFNKIIRPEILQTKARNYPKIRHSTLALFCSTVEKMPIGTRQFDLKNYEYKGFGVLSYLVKPSKIVFKLLPLIFGSDKTNANSRLKLNTEQLEITTDSALQYTLDGEIYTQNEGRLTIEAGPRIQFLVV